MIDYLILYEECCRFFPVWRFFRASVDRGAVTVVQFPYKGVSSMEREKKVLIAMSGGVDSSVAAYLARQAGLFCVGGTMCQLSQDDGRNTADARAVAEKLGMEFYAFDLREKFREAVVERFIAAYERGWTPNPCVECNRNLKFEALFQKAAAMGCTHVATGHYARVELGENGRWQLKKGLDPGKDQSYVLYSLTQEQLARTLFPLGRYRKEEIRAMAEEQGFVSAHKKDSQDICFIPDGDYAAFISRSTGKSYPEGDFVDPEGRVLGRHRGLIHYTVGQRRGLGVSGGRPLYVRELRPESNTVVLAENKDLFQRTAVLEDFNWVSIVPPEGELRALARCRYHHKEQPARIRVLGSGRVEVTYDEPQRAMTKGQAMVLYQDDMVLGGGTIVQVRD